jgi:dUTPase
VIIKSDQLIASYSTTASADVDLRFERTMVYTSLYPDMPASCEAEIRHGSGQAIKKRMKGLNPTDTIDVQHRYKVYIITVNLSNESTVIGEDEKKFHAVFVKHEKAGGVSLDPLTESDRSSGRFEYSGKI